MNEKSLVASWIARCDKEIDKYCQKDGCPKCKYRNICIKVMKLSVEFRRKGYLDESNK